MYIAPPASEDDVAAYIRSSTDKQEREHQRDDIEDWSRQHAMNLPAASE